MAKLNDKEIRGAEAAIDQHSEPELTPQQEQEMDEAIQAAIARKGLTKRQGSSCQI